MTAYRCLYECCHVISTDLYSLCVFRCDKLLGQFARLV